MNSWVIYYFLLVENQAWYVLLGFSLSVHGMYSVETSPVTYLSMLTCCDFVQRAHIAEDFVPNKSDEEYEKVTKFSRLLKYESIKCLVY
jgi:hypothetical protein